QVYTYKGDSISNFIKFIDKFVIEDSSSDAEFKIRGDINIAGSKLSIINYNLDAKEQVWLDAENFNANIKDLDVSGEVYMANIKNLSLEAEKNGENYKVERLSSLFKMDDKGISFDALTLTTQSSHLKEYVNLKYDSIA